LLKVQAAEQYQFLAGMKDWPEIPPLAVITGNNGEGKSLLLKYIQQALHSQSADGLLQKHEAILIENPTMHFSRWVSSSGRDPNYYLRKIPDESWLKRIAEYFTSKQGQLPDDDIEQGIIKSMRKDIETNTLVLDEKILEDIRSYAEKYLPLEMDKIRVSDPVSFLSYIFNMYNLRLEHLKREYQESKYIRKLFASYKDTNATKLEEFGIGRNLDLEEFLTQVIEVEEKKEKFLDYFVSLKAGVNPVDEVNTILELSRFKYRISFSEDSSRSHDYNLRFIKDGSEIYPHTLSSGEKSMMTLLSMLYATNFPSLGNIHGTSNDPFVKLILLDEFDAHFDPNFCKIFLKVVTEEFVVKRGIQVIMATHRPDTVKLAPDDGIFVVQQDREEQREVLNCHKLQAMFRMTKNVREIAGFKCKVYTESTDDASFYEGVYGALGQRCRIVREKRQFDVKEAKYQWQITPQLEYRILSERYQMQFHTVSAHGKEGGGCAAVKKSIERDTNAFASMSQEEDMYGVKVKMLPAGKFVFREPALHHTFGVLDSDFGVDHGLEKKGLENSIVVTKRHSLDNFIFDPVIICSALSTQEIEWFVQNSLKGDNKEQALEYLKTIKYKLDEKSFNSDLQEVISGYFRHLFGTILSNNRKWQKIINGTIPQSKEGTQDARYQQIIKDISAKMSAQQQELCGEEVVIIIDPENSFTLKYPKEFLEMRGHDLHDHYFGNQTNSDGYSMKDLIISKVSFRGLDFIPIDLAEVFFSLNQKIRENVRTIIKPDREDMTELLGDEVEEAAQDATIGATELLATDSSHPDHTVY